MGGSAHVTAGTGIRVRMYRVGFGDFFLVTIPGDPVPQHILIDCGVFKGTSQTGDIGSIEVAVQHMAEATGERDARYLSLYPSRTPALVRPELLSHRSALDMCEIVP